MTSILAKILLWSLGTLGLSLVAYWAIERALNRHGPSVNDPFWSMVALVEEETCRAYEEGGPERLSEHLRLLDAKLPGQHLLTDPHGRDLASNEDRANLLEPNRNADGPLRLHDGRIVLVGKPRNGRYRLLTLVRPWFEPPNILPYYAAIVLVITVMGTVLAAHLVVPLKRLRHVVERFGRGDLGARAGSRRQDEIGALSRTFDEMADRIEILLAAERRLLQDVSHELRSPLARLGFAVQLARTSEDRAKAMDRVQHDVDRLAVLVDELLQLTRAEGDPSAHDREEVRLDDLLRALVEDCALEAEAKQCRIALRAHYSCVVRGDRELLRRALENVLRNAIRHGPPGTTIEVDHWASGDMASVAIRDQGTGVPAESLERIFQPFYRVHDDRCRDSGGMGLGLAIARRAVALHGGTITARNLDPGLCVTVSMPRHLAGDGVQTA